MNKLLLADWEELTAAERREALAEAYDLGQRVAQECAQEAMEARVSSLLELEGLVAPPPLAREQYFDALNAAPTVAITNADERVIAFYRGWESISRIVIERRERGPVDWAEAMREIEREIKGDF